MVLAVFGITLDSAKTYASIGVVLLLVAAFVAAWLMKTLVQKLLVFVLFAALAFAVWTQRTALQDCADLVRTNLELSTTVVTDTEDECTFFGVAVSIPAPTVS
jgi:hypothetical protein